MAIATSTSVSLPSSPLSDNAARRNGISVAAAAARLLAEGTPANRQQQQQQQVLSPRSSPLTNGTGHSGFAAAALGPTTSAASSSAGFVRSRRASSGSNALSSLSAVHVPASMSLALTGRSDRKTRFSWERPTISQCLK